MVAHTDEHKITECPLRNGLKRPRCAHKIESLVKSAGPNQNEILIVGLGSAGRRHLANLQTLGWTEFRLLRTHHSTLPEADLAGFPVAHELDEALAHRPLAVIVSNPPSLHIPIALEAARHGLHLFVEKPLSDRPDDLDLLETSVQARNLVAITGFQFRFNPGLAQLKSWIDSGAIGDVISAQAHWGEYLPGMHPWEDHRTGIAARADLGGGVLLTLCHPFDYLRWLMGDVVAATALATNVSSLPEFHGIGVDCAVDVLLRFASGASAHVHLNFVQRPAQHRLVIVGTRGTVSWSQDDHAAHLRDTQSAQTRTVHAPQGFERNSMFLDQMRHFLACIRREVQPRCTLADGRAALAISLAASRALGGASEWVQL